MHPRTRKARGRCTFLNFGKSAKKHLFRLPAKPPGSCQMKIGRKSMPPTTRNCYVSDLLRSPLRRTLSWGRTLKTSSNSTTTYWSVNDLLTSALQRTLAWEKTVKTSRATTTRRRRRTLSWEKNLVDLQHHHDEELEYQRSA